MLTLLLLVSISPSSSTAGITQALACLNASVSQLMGRLNGFSSSASHDVANASLQALASCLGVSTASKVLTAVMAECVPLCLVVDP
jgi:hypothetical protein